MNIADEFSLDEDSFTWKDLSMCVNFPTEAHFEDGDSKPSVSAAAREVCYYCPVQEFCLKYALENKEEGIWGGHKVKGGKIVD